MQANYGENEIRSILQKVRIFNKNVGEYQMFAITSDFDYTVKLSNGKILLKIEELQDDTADSLTPEGIQAIANRFVSSDGSSYTQKNKPEPEAKVIVEKPKPTQTKAWLWVIIILVITALGIGGIMVVNNPNAIPGVKVEINTPSPVVITSRADGSKSGLLKARTTVWASVQNQGGSGTVLVTFHVYQDGNDYERTKQTYMNSNESQDFEVTFNEVKMLGGEITYHVEAIAQ